MYNEYVYILRAGPFYKIGRTVDFPKRIAQLSIQLPFPCEVFKIFSTNDAVALERWLHEAYEYQRVNGEWFELSDLNRVHILLYPSSIDMNDPDSIEETFYANRRLVRAVYPERRAEPEFAL